MKEKDAQVCMQSTCTLNLGKSTYGKCSAGCKVVLLGRLQKLEEIHHRLCASSMLVPVVLGVWPTLIWEAVSKWLSVYRQLFQRMKRRKLTLLKKRNSLLHVNLIAFQVSQGSTRKLQLPPDLQW